MGLAKQFGWTGIDNYVSPNRNMLLGLSAGLLSGDLGNAPLYAMQGRAADDANTIRAKEEAERVKNINQTVEWARQAYPQQLSGVPDHLAGQMAVDLWKQQFAQNTSGDPASVREWQYFSGLSPEQQSAYLRMKRSVPYLDLGTEFAQPDPANPGAIAGPGITKDNFTPAYDAAAGTAAGKNDAQVQVDFDSLNSKMPGLKAVVGELSQLAKVATYTQTGQLIDNTMRETGMEPSEAAIARTKYIAMVDNQILPLLRDTFGAAFTAKEGETLRATLGDPNKAPAEKQVILEAFIEQKMRDLEALKSRLPASSNNDPLGIR